MKYWQWLTHFGHNEATLLVAEPVTVGVLPDPFTVDEAAYTQAARRAGWERGGRVLQTAKDATLRATRLHQFRTFLATSGVGVYDAERVKRYMDKLIEAANIRERLRFRQSGITYYWEWRPLESYSQPIPEVVLNRIGDIREAFPDVAFQVTQVEKDLDPFLAAVFEGERFIIERWDEPAFRS